MIPLIPTVGVMTNSVWGYYITASQGYTVPINIPTWRTTGTNGSWSPARQAPNGHSYAFPLCAPCPIKIYSGSANYSSASNFSPIPQIQFITTSIAGNDLFLPTPPSSTAQNEKFYSPILAQDGCFYAFDYIHNIGSTVIGKIMKLDPSIDRYTTYSFNYPVSILRRMSSTILGYDGYIYGIPVTTVTISTQNNRIFRFHPNDPSNVQSSSLLKDIPVLGTAAYNQWFGTLSSRPGAIYWIPRAPRTTNNLAIVLSSSLFSPGTSNGISAIPLPSTLAGVTTNEFDLAYWPSKGHEDTGYTYWSPRMDKVNSPQNARALVLDPYGGTAGTGSLILDTNTNVYNSNGTTTNFTFGFARSLNGDLFALPAADHIKSVVINKNGTGSTSNFYPINNNISLKYASIYPNVMNNSINIWPSSVYITSSNFSTTNWNYFMSVKGYYKNVTNFVEQSSYSPLSNINAITSSLYNWLENNTCGN
jgi:hypothetical protein